VPSGEDDVFAVDASSGKILWEHKANLDQKISVVCCGWLSRGVALGEGNVDIGQLDGNLVALDQKTGKVAWKTLVMPWQRGFSITNARSTTTACSDGRLRRRVRDPRPPHRL
jgi:alcohol dehydrogenase (cytochrome c)